MRVRVRWGSERLSVAREAREKRRGAVVVLVAVCLTAVLGVVALVLDGGAVMSERRHAQAAADAAALAAAAELYKDYSVYQGKDLKGSARQAALDLARANGYANDGKTSIVTVHIPPASGTFAGRAGFAEVIVQYNQKRGFSALFNQGDVAVRARAVARGNARHLPTGVVLLNPTETDSFHVSGNGSMGVKNGSIFVNSSAGIAAHWSGNGVISAASIEITGGYQKSGHPVIIGDIHSKVQPTPDPFTALPEPKTSDHTLRATSHTSISHNGKDVLHPGVYRGGISISGQSQVTMMPGVYIMEGGGFRISGQGALSGEEVMIYNMLGAGGDHGQILIAGNGAVHLTPPATGIYQGFSFFQQRTQTDRLQISGNGSVHISGVVYAAKANTQLSGNGSIGFDILGGGYVCDTMQVSGNGSFNIDLGGNPAPAVRHFSLVE